MQRVISIKPISVTTVSPQKLKRIRAEKFSVLPRHSLQRFSSPLQSNDLLIDDDNMPISVSDPETSTPYSLSNMSGFCFVLERLF